jgi:hypothetical protein
MLVADRTLGRAANIKIKTAIPERFGRILSLSDRASQQFGL